MLRISVTSRDYIFWSDSIYFRVAFLIKLQFLINFIKKEALAQVFSCEYCEISKNTFFTEHLWTTASSSRRLSVICYLWYSNWFKNETSLILNTNSEAYSEPCQTSKMEIFAKIVNGFWLFFAKNFILDVWKDSEFASEASNDLRKKFHLRCLTGFWIHFCSQ